MGTLLLAMILVPVYFFPVLLASKRKTGNRGGVLVLNLFFGWTFIGWVVALALAAGGAKEAGAVTA